MAERMRVNSNLQKLPAAASGGESNYVRTAMPTLITIVGVTTVLYLGRDVLMPLAVALLLTFALAPIVSFMRRRAVPKVLAVVATVVVTFLAIAMFAFLVASQVSNLAQNIPTYQNNIVEKVRSLREMGAGGGIVDHMTGLIERVGQELQSGTQTIGLPEGAAQPKPLPVEIVAQQSPLDILFNIVVPLISPFATAGLIVVVVIFMLLEREELRDRFIRLAGYGDLHRTTEALQDAGSRLSRYLLMQLLVNVTYAIPIALGLWLLGIPNALLWGLLTLVLRFVPYIGPAIGMFLPMLVALAATPGWLPLVLTAALFIGVELFSNNVMEPWLYGSRTGLSPLAIIVSAIFWSWLWGPLGLVLSTPLTVCLVVLGRYVPQFEFLSVLFGNEPVLEPHARLYQRLLAGDPDEAADNAEDYLEENYLVDFYDKIGIPALVLGEQDRQRGVMADQQRVQFAAAVHALVADLEEIADEEEEENDQDDGKSDGEDEEQRDTPDLPDGEGRSVLCVGGRGEIDDGAAAMVAQVLGVQGAQAAVVGHGGLELGQMAKLPLDGVDTVLLAYLNSGSVAHVRHAVRRLKRRRAGLFVGLFIPTFDGEAKALADTTNADFVATTVTEAVTQGLAERQAGPVKPKRKLMPRRRPASKAAA